MRARHRYRNGRGPHLSVVGRTFVALAFLSIAAGALLAWSL